MKVFPLLLLLFLIVNFTTAQTATIDSLKHELTVVKEDTNKVNLLNKLSYSYAWSNADTGIQYAQQALDLAQKINYETGTVNAQVRMCWALGTLGNYPLSLDYAFKALDLSQKLHNTEMIASATGAIAGLYCELGDYNNSLSYYNKALKLYEELQDEFNAAIIWNEIGGVYLGKNQPDSAILYSKKSYRVIKIWDAQPIYLGTAYLEKGNYDSAMYWYRIGLALSIKNHTEKGSIDVDNNITLIQKNKGNIDSAVWYAKKALSEKMGKVYPLGLLKATTMLADLYELQNKPDSAFKYLKTSISLKDSLFNREKTMAIQNLVFKEREKQKEIEASKLQYKNQVRTIFLLTSLIVFLLIAIILYRNNRHQKFRLQLERSEKENQLANLRHKTSELEMQALRAQMNPHFIFNSLNSINRFILQNNKAQASEYLTKFSRLVRLILQNSQSALISLESELESLQLYLELEAVRFDNHFEFKINVNNNLETDVIKVPPLIIQPYAENAIWHGLMHKEEKGRLEIELFQQENILCCRITDDGIGRKKAAELKSKSASTYKSMGMQITASRIEMLQQKKYLDTYIKITDLILPDGTAGGTEVLLKIPVCYD